MRYTINEVGRQLGVTNQLTQGLIYGLGITPVKIGTAYTITEEEVALVAERYRAARDTHDHVRGGRGRKRREAQTQTA